MIRAEAKRRLEQKGVEVNKASIDEAANGIDLSYQVLCGFKHSNPLMVGHVLNARESILGIIAPENRFIVMALPDTRPKDNWVKAMVLSSAVHSAFLSLLNSGYVISFHSSRAEEWLKQLNEKMSRALAELDEVLKKPESPDG
jgi:hypothetical protein